MKNGRTLNLTASALLLSLASWACKSTSSNKSDTLEAGTTPPTCTNCSTFVRQGGSGFGVFVRTGEERRSGEFFLGQSRELVITRQQAAQICNTIQQDSKAFVQHQIDVAAMIRTSLEAACYNAWTPAQRKTLEEYNIPATACFNDGAVRKIGSRLEIDGGLGVQFTFGETPTSRTHTETDNHSAISSNQAFSGNQVSGGSANAASTANQSANAIANGNASSGSSSNTIVRTVNHSVNKAGISYSAQANITQNQLFTQQQQPQIDSCRQRILNICGEITNNRRAGRNYNYQALEPIRTECRLPGNTYCKELLDLIDELAPAQPGTPAHQARLDTIQEFKTSYNGYLEMQDYFENVVQVSQESWAKAQANAQTGGNQNSGTGSSVSNGGNQGFAGNTGNQSSNDTRTVSDSTSGGKYNEVRIALNVGIHWAAPSIDSISTMRRFSNDPEYMNTISAFRSQIEPILAGGLCGFAGKKQ